MENFLEESALLRLWLVNLTALKPPPKRCILKTQIYVLYFQRVVLRIPNPSPFNLLKEFFVTNHLLRKKKNSRFQFHELSYFLITVSRQRKTN